MDVLPGSEVELKYRIDDAGTWEHLHGTESIGERYHLAPGASATVVDAYVDTPDFALLRAGYALRVRDKQNARIVTMKSVLSQREGAKHTRLELEAPGIAGKAPTDPAAWPDMIRHLVGAITGRVSDFRRLAAIVQERTERQVGLNGSRVAVLTLDSYRLEDPYSDVATAGPQPTLRELEVELVSGNEMDLAEIEQTLAGLAGLKASDESKLSLALRRRGSSRSGDAGISAGQSMAEAARAIWRSQLVEILLNEAGARLGEDIEYVHDMRVATRRARAAARIFGEFFVAKELRPHLRALRTTARKLGDVRDLDVALDKLVRYQAKLSPDEADALEGIAHTWREQRVVAYSRLLAWLEGDAYGNFLSRFHALCSEPGAGARTYQSEPGESPTPHHVDDVLPVAIWDAFCKVRAYEHVFNAGEVPEATLHALRIDCKRLRYTLEPVRGTMGPDGEDLVKQLKRLQDHLGDLNDAAVTRDSLQTLRNEQGADDALEHYLDVQVRTIDQLRRTFAEVWIPFIDTLNRERLGRATAQL